MNKINLMIKLQNVIKIKRKKLRIKKLKYLGQIMAIVRYQRYIQRRKPFSSNCTI